MDEEKSKKLTKFIKSGIMNLVVVGIGLVYIFFTMVTIKKTDVSILELLGKSAIGIICGILIKQGIGENGFNRGYSSKTWNEEIQKYNEACNQANPYMERVDNFYYCEEIEKRKSSRRAIMMGARLKYSDFFDENENFIGQDKMEKLTKFQKKAIKKCVSIKIYTLNLFSEYVTVTAKDTKKETGDKEQRAKMVGKNSITQILVAIAGAYFVPMINNWNWGTFIFSTLQVIMWCGSGVMQLYTNYNYVVIDKINKLKRKKELIQKFVHGCKEEGLYKENPYEVRAAKEEQMRIEKEQQEQARLEEERLKAEKQKEEEDRVRAEQEKERQRMTKLEKEVELYKIQLEIANNKIAEITENSGVIENESRNDEQPSIGRIGESEEPEETVA